MKKVFCFVMAILICASLAFPAVAAENEFVPSITYKGYPEISTVKDDAGKDAIGVVYDADGAVMNYVYEGCLLITPIAEAETSTKISEDAEKLLLEVYEALCDGTMTLPYDKVDGIDADKMVIRELMDVSFDCGDDHAEAVENDDHLIEVTFELGVAADDVVVVMAYVDEEWVPAEEVTNNGDGSVTCLFEKLCPVAIAVEA